MRLRRVLIVCLLMLLPFGTAAARQVLQGDLCTIEVDERVVGTVFVLCQDLVINGVVDGNLIGAATNTTISGEVTNGVYLLGGQLDILGTLHDDIHFSGLVLRIQESAELANDVIDVFALSISTRVAPGITIPGTLTTASYQTLIEGDVGGEVNSWGAALEIEGRVGGNVAANVGDVEEIEGTPQIEALFIPFPFDIDFVNPGLRLGDAAYIVGDLRYEAPTASLNQEAVADQIGGALTFDLVTSQFEPPTDEESLVQGLRAYFANSVREVVTLAVVGGLGLLFAPQKMQAPITNLRRRPLTSLGVGALTFTISFFVFFVALVASALILFVLSLLNAGNLLFAGLVVLLIADVGGASLFYFVAIFVARSIFCLAVGRWMARRIFEDDDTLRYLFVSLLIGSTLIGFAVSLPIVGLFVNALALFLGLGAIISLLQAQLRNLREAPEYADNTYTPPTRSGFGSRWISVDPPELPPDQTPSPRPTRPRRPASSGPRPRHSVGLDDLPEDFVWWDEL